MTFESDVAAISSRSIWVRARDRSEATGTTLKAVLDYDGAALAAGRQDVTPPSVTTASPPPLSSKAFFFNGGTGFSCGLSVMKGIIDVFASSTLANTVPAMAFNGSTEQNEYWANNGTTSGFIGARFATAFVSTGYTLWGRPDVPSQAPKDWTFQGSNDTTNGTDGTWTTLDTRTGQTSPSGVHYTFSNTTAYAAYRLNVSSAQSGAYVALSNLDFDGAPHRTNHGGTSGEFWIVRKTASSGNVFGPNETGTGGQSFVPLTAPSSGIYWQIGSSSRRDNIATSVTWDAWHIERWVKDSTGVMALWVKPSGGTWSLVDSANTGAASWATVLYLGANGASATSNDAQAELIHFNASLTASATTAPTTGDALKVDNYLTDKHFAAVTAGGVTVSAPVLASVSTVPAPTVSVASGVTVTAPVLASSSALPAPTVSSVTAATVAAPVLASSSALLAPTVTSATAVNVAAPVLASTSVLRAPTVVTPAPATTLLDFRHARRLTWVENGTQVDVPDDVTLLKFSSSRGFKMRGMLTPVAPPLGVLTEWPIQRQAHLMPALSAATPRYRVGNPANPGEYAVDYGTVGRPHVFVGGQDYTYKRGVPVLFEDYATAMPFNATQASVQMPQLKPWDQPGTGDLSALTKDAPVEIVMVRPDDTLDYLWEGFFQVDEENSGTGEDYTFRAQGLFAQAAHEPWDPPVFMDATDIGTLIADALNGVTHRRWNKIPRVTTGILSRNRGSQGQSVWQYVQDLLSQAWTDDGRQWTIARVGPYSYRIQVKASTSVADWTVTKGAPGVEVNLSVDQSTRRDAIYGRGISKGGGTWEGRVFPNLKFGATPRYPFNNTSTNLSVGTTDADTSTGNGVTTWQRQMRELGYPVTVDGVMNSADTKWVLKIQRDRGLTVDGSLGPQTWQATWENNSTDADTTSYRRPLATLAEVEPYLYSANGARVGSNPADDPSIIRHAMPEVNFGSGISKSEAAPLAMQMLLREQTPGIAGTITLLTDPHEAGSSRFDIKPGDNVKVVGHRGADVVLQVAEVSVQGLSVNLTVDSKARDALSVLAILERNRDALRDPSARTGTGLDSSALNKSSVVQFEDESDAGFVARTAVNGDSGLWTVRKTFVSEVGVAKVVFTATAPKAELYVALFNRPIRTSVLASLIGNPGASSDGWYDNIDVLREKYGLMEVFGSPGSPGGYWPRQKGDGPLTGRLEDSASTLYDSPYGGFVWVAMFTSRSTWVEGRVFPAVPT